MKYGKPDPNELDSIDFSLPDDHPDTKQTLTKIKGVANTEIYVGCAKWGRKEWVGNLYPAGTKDKDFLSEYVKQFNGIELNGTFYSIKKENVEKWAETAGQGFKFCPKFVRRISHLKRLNDVAETTDYFLDACSAFGDKLGIAFLQMPDNFSPNRLDRLDQYLSELPTDFEACVELRHTSWFTDPVVYDETFSMLAGHNRGAVITDVALRRDVVHMRLTCDTVFVRFNGYDLHPSDYMRLDVWVDRVHEWIQQGISKIHFYMHQEDETFTPQICLYFINKLNEVAGTNLVPPRL